MDKKFLENLDTFTKSGLLGNIPQLLTAFAAKIGKNYILYQPDYAKEIKFDNEVEEMAPLVLTKLRFRTKDKIPLFGRVYSPPHATGGTPIIVYFMSNAESIAALKSYIKPYCEAMNCHFMVFNFRGYGNSRGVASQSGFRIDI